MTLNKVKVLVLVVLLTMVFAVSLHTPKTTEAMWIGGLMIELYCNECSGQWRACCAYECYKSVAEGQPTTEHTINAYDNCVNDCTINLASLCSLPY